MIGKQDKQIIPILLSLCLFPWDLIFIFIFKLLVFNFYLLVYSIMEIRRQSRHQKTTQKTVGKMIFGLVFLIGIMVLFWYNIKDYQKEEATKTVNSQDHLPEAVAGIIYNKPNFSLSYVEQFEIPEWVSYTLTVGMLNQKKFPREQDFNPDPAISTTSAHYHDYKQSGYRRGHLVPSADMAWNKPAMDATFLLSNIAPMREEFNDGVWLELEHNVRDWARLYKEVDVVTGPVFHDSITVIGNNEVLVPRYFYKAIFTTQNDKPIVIGFLFDQSIDNTDRLDAFVVPIDSIEKLTGIDLFANRYGDWDEEIRLEKSDQIDVGYWPFNEKWYLERMEE